MIDRELADQLLAWAETRGIELLGPDGLLSKVNKAVLEWALAEETTEHLGDERHPPMVWVGNTATARPVRRCSPRSVAFI
ncbi:MAG: hypothetical protein ACRDST_00865 [Pseudonocardiaceae bacterium]